MIDPVFLVFVAFLVGLVLARINDDNGPDLPRRPNTRPAMCELT